MPVNYIFKTNPYAHQKDALDKSIGKRSYAFFMEMGTGKSKLLIDTISNTEDIDFVCIIAPKGVYQNWVNKEIPDHFPETIPHRVIQWRAQPTKEQRAEMQTVKDPFDGLTIWVMNVESLSTKRGNEALTWLANKFGERGLIAIDESTSIKNPKAKRSKNIIKAAHMFKYRRILTGSPVTQSPLDLFSQCEFLGPRFLGHDSFYTFQARYAVTQSRTMGAYSFQQVVGYRHIEELTAKVDKFAYRVLKKDCLDLPEKNYTIRNVSLTDEQRLAYVEIRDEAMTVLNNELISVNSIMTQMIRLQQVLSGHLKTDDGRIIDLPNNRVQAVLDVLEETSGKVIIWSRFRYDIEALQAAISEKYGARTVASYYGDTSDEQRREAVQSFQNPTSELRYFIGNPQTAGYGLTLTEANTVIYYANDFNLETRVQSEDRCHRIGQKNPVTYVDLITPGTIDERIVKALRKKIDISAKVLGEEAREWLQLAPK
jgi:SNF2 family DNA or RNA helicase